MSIVTVSFEHVWLSVFRAVSWLSPLLAVCMQGSRQLSRLTLWGLSFSTILHLRRHSIVSSSTLCSSPTMKHGAILRISIANSKGSRPSTNASKFGMAGTESSRGNGSTNSANQSAWFNPRGLPSGSLRMWLSSISHSRFRGRTPLFPFWFHTLFAGPASRKLREIEQLTPTDRSGSRSLLFLPSGRGLRCLCKTAEHCGCSLQSRNVRSILGRPVFYSNRESSIRSGCDASLRCKMRTIHKSKACPHPLRQQDQIRTFQSSIGAFAEEGGSLACRSCWHLGNEPRIREALSNDGIHERCQPFKTVALYVALVQPESEFVDVPRKVLGT